MVAEAFSKVGRKGAVVTLKGGKHAAKDDSLYLVEGMQFDCDYFLPYFVTNSEEMSFDLENCKLLLVDKIGNAKDLASVLKDAIKGGYPILIIAEDIQREALDAFLASRPLDAPKIAVVKTYTFWVGKANFLDDIAVLTGATVIREEAGLTLENVESEVLGFASKVVVADGGTTIVGDGSTKESLNREAEKIRELVLAKETAVKKINGPAQSIKEICQEARLDREIQCLDERLVRLSERVAVIEVGAETEKEVEEKKQRLDVALNKIKVLSSDDPNYDYNAAPIKTVAEECVDKIFDVIYARGLVDALFNVDELLFNIGDFITTVLSYDDIEAERLLESTNSAGGLVRYILSSKGLV